MGSSGGADLLSGGSGADIFVFGTTLGAANADRISDFISGVDTLLLANGNGDPFAAMPSGALSASALDIIGDATMANAATRIVYDTQTGAVLRCRW